ncbi:glycosyltransferase family 2 protein [Solitalea lacus]|uniref:glycosyltransferase family 2 protein n=1 Tax=Solitalea lacus TaxID=2911172 RepID=UPI001EDAC431|nr:glycosyltransferase family 2 protein [Solitalea lacus]UKJ08249.1 glycosyltransferase [Solitalea lacus]
MNRPILSLCIPTYNRSEILNNTLKSLINNPEFDSDLIEVLVSDNCSTDDTKEVVKRYPKVKYFRNEENVKDANFAIALNYANGEYVRLFNDTLSFKPNMLRFMICKIQENLDSKRNVYFYGETFLHKNTIVKVNSLSEYIKEVSFYSTWIANFGTWKDNFLNLKDIDKYVDKQLVQVDWNLQLFTTDSSSNIYFNDFYDIESPKKKGGYNVFKVFVSNYLLILKQHKLSALTYEREKYQLCKNFVYPWILKLFVFESKKYSFQTDGAFKTLFNKYWYEPYFYIICLKFFIHKIRS